MTFGFSRDDIGGFLAPTTSKKEILPGDPFQVLDRDSVGVLVQNRHREGPRHPPRPQGRHLRRARRRPELGRVLPPHRHELRELLALPRADRTPGRGRPKKKKPAAKKRAPVKKGKKAARR
jgi:hypothetical protein